MKEFYAEIDDHLKEYESGTITISEDIEFSMRETVRQITHYIMSKYMGGQLDEQGRRKPFRNIGNAIVDLEWRAKNIDRKAIEAEETDGDYIFARRQTEHHRRAGAPMGVVPRLTFVAS